jgi:PilZ domain
MNTDGVGGRVATTLSCNWGLSEDCPRNGKITSLSAKSCFVQTKAIANDGQQVFVKCWLPSERWLPLRGTVSYALPRVGFSITFAELSEEQQQMLELLIDYFRTESD